ncbi:hypothetical protein NDU88_007591 [Pleurodeles waltl]|uniref:Uncharacterized protein n=1 Tax=Pleurodeles waltl TaxID=8319 RepID=A0AAV7N2J0_PLEWA|nr:hypothetical protein NDU88_007591 [Pleurodeles waltl]
MTSVGIQECADIGKGSKTTAEHLEESVSQKEQDEEPRRKTARMNEYREEEARRKERKTERELWGKAEQFGRREATRHIPGGAWLVQVRDRLQGHIAPVPRRVGKAGRGWGERWVEDPGYTLGMK